MVPVAGLRQGIVLVEFNDVFGEYYASVGLWLAVKLPKDCVKVRWGLAGDPVDITHRPDLS